MTEYLQELVRIPSPNPPGNTRDIAAYISGRLAKAGCLVETNSPPEKPEAHSVVASIGNDNGPSILYHAHIDTVPVPAAENWTVAPYEGISKDGRIYGRGSVDDKGPLAAMLVALERLTRAQLRGRLTLVAAAEEEVGGQLGTRWLVDADLLPMSDFVVVGEQTHNRVATANKGVMRATVRTLGRSVHATNPDRGENAIAKMVEVVRALEGYHRTLADRKHPMVGVPTCNVGTIQGGVASNIVPDRCEIRLDRRMVPGETAEAVIDELRAVIASVDEGYPQTEIGDFLLSAPFESRADEPLTQAFLSVVGKVLDTNPGPVGYLPGSDAKHLVKLARGGMVVFGPGSYETAHSRDEYVDIGELEQATQILHDFGRGVLVQEREQ